MPTAEELMKSPIADRLVMIVLLLAIAILQLMRFIRPARTRVENLHIDTKGVVEQLAAINANQTALLGRQSEIMVDVRHAVEQQSIALARAMERQGGARLAVDAIANDLAEHRRMTEARGHA